MERVNVLVSKEAKKILVKYQRSHGLTRQDDALNGLLLEYDCDGDE